MGRIKTQLIKRLTNQFVKMHPDKVKSNFDENKVIVGQHLEGASKKIRNAVAGYVTRLSKNKEQY